MHHLHQILASVLLLFQLAIAVPDIVDLSYAKYRGTSLPNGISQWLGIRYAAPPVGNLRFMPPHDPIQSSSLQMADQVSLDAWLG